MNWKNAVIGFMMFCGVMLLAFASGAYWQFERDRKAPGRITLTYVERPIILPPKEQSSHAHPAPAQRDRLIDSLIAQARRTDSLETLLRRKLLAQIVSFDDTISVKDSLGGFYARELSTIEYDPISEVMRKLTKYADVKFTAAVIEKEKYIEPTFWERLYAGSGIAAVVIVLYLLLGG